MPVRLPTALIAILCLAGAPAAAVAQTGRPWVDPPSPVPPVEPAPPVEAAPPAPAPLDAEESPAAQPSRPRAAPSAPPRAPSRDTAAPQRPVAPPPARDTAAPQRPVAPPPARDTAAPQRPPAPPPSRDAARPPERPGISVAAREREARELATEYLDFWSAPNPLTLDATPEFYGPQVTFHRRSMSSRELLAEKRRFVQRWPVRAYTPRLDSMRANCDADAGMCIVTTLFDFMAVSPERGRRSQGTAALTLGVSFARGRPVIVSEDSRVLRRGAVGASFEETQDD